MATRPPSTSWKPRVGWSAATFTLEPQELEAATNPSAATAPTLSCLNPRVGLNRPRDHFTTGRAGGCAPPAWVGKALLVRAHDPEGRAFRVGEDREPAAGEVLGRHHLLGAGGLG